MTVEVQNMLGLRRRRPVGNDGKCGLQRQGKAQDLRQDLSGRKLTLSA